MGCPECGSRIKPDGYCSVCGLNTKILSQINQESRVKPTYTSKNDNQSILTVQSYANTSNSNSTSVPISAPVSSIDTQKHISPNNAIAKTNKQNNEVLDKTVERQENTLQRDVRLEAELKESERLKKEVEELRKLNEEEKRKFEEYRQNEQRKEQEKLRKIELRKQQRIENEGLGMSIASLVMGIIAITFGGFLFIPQILGIIFGVLGKKGRKLRGCSIAGIITSGLAFVIAGTLIGLFISDSVHTERAEAYLENNQVESAEIEIQKVVFGVDKNLKYDLYVAKEEYDKAAELFLSYPYLSDTQVEKLQSIYEFVSEDNKARIDKAVEKHISESEKKTSEATEPLDRNEGEINEKDESGVVEDEVDSDNAKSEESKTEKIDETTQINENKEEKQEALPELEPEAEYIVEYASEGMENYDLGQYVSEFGYPIGQCDNYEFLVDAINVIKKYSGVQDYSDMCGYLVNVKGFSNSDIEIPFSAIELFMQEYESGILMDCIPKWYEEGVERVYKENADYTEELRTFETQFWVCVSASDGYVNFRSGDGTEYDIICSITNGEYLPVYEEKGNWYYTYYDNCYGWINKTQVEKL